MIVSLRFGLGAALLLAAARGFCAEASASSALTTVLAVKKLSEAEIKARPQVRITGVVTYYDPDKFLFFIQDETAGIYVQTGGEDLHFTPGDLLRVEGLAAKGRVSNSITQPAFTKLGRALLPAPKKLNAGQTLDISTDADRVQIAGVIRSAAEEDGRLVLFVGVGKDRIPVTIYTLARGQQRRSVGKLVSATGVHTALYNEKRERYGSRLLCASARDLTILDAESAPPNDDLPVDAVRAALVKTNGALVHIQVLLDEASPGNWIKGHDDTGSILAFTTQRDPAKKGTVLDLAGYVSRGNTTNVLLDAYFERIGFSNSTSFAHGEKLAAGPPLESAMEIRRMSPQEARRQHPVRLRGVITYYDPDWRLCFLQGATEGIYVDTHDQPMDIAPGELAIVSGFTGPGDFAPVVSKPKFDIMGKAPMPESKPVLYAQLLAGSEDSQWLRLACTIQAVKDEGPRFQLEVVPSDFQGTANIFVPKTVDRTVPPDLSGARVEVEAVCITDFDSARRLKGVTFLCPGFRYVHVLEAAQADPFTLPLTPIGSAFEFRAGAGHDQRLHVAGTVTWADPSGAFFLQDATGALKVQCETNHPRLGQSFHVVGFRNVREAIPALNHAVLRLAGEAPEVLPEAVSATKAFHDATTYEGRLLQTSGQLLESRTTREGMELTLLDGQTVFSASLRGAVPRWAAKLQIASTLGVTGVAVFGKDAAFQARSMQLLARIPSDVQLLGSPPWWNPRRISIAAAILALVGFLAALWISILRSRVAFHKRKLEANMERQRALEAQVLQSQKMESIGHLAGGVAHDFNNMLLVILGYADVLKHEKISDLAAEAVNEITTAGHRAADLTRQLLLFSRKQKTAPKTLDLNEIVRGMTRMLERLLGEDVALRFEPGPGTILLNADKGMLEQALMNLAVNARDAMPKGGSLLISTMKRELSPPDLPKASPCKAGDYACLSIADTGSGIPEEYLPKIFEPFFTTKEVGKGTGLGLATVYGIVQQHQGWIDVQSKPGQGTSFTLYFPAAVRAPAAAAIQPAPGLLDGQRGNILLVEDDAQVRRLASQALKRAGYDVVEAESGPAALGITERCTSIDLLISDVIMPGGMTGGDLAKVVQAKFPSLPIILTSGYSEVGGRELQLPDGAVFLQKPYPPEVLLRTVAGALPTKGAAKP